MVYRGRLRTGATVVSIKDTSLSAAVGTDWVAAWDLGGRLYSLWRRPHTYRRGLNGRVLHKWRDEAADAPGPYDARQRVSIEGPEADAVVDETAERLRDVLSAIVADPRAWRAEDGRSPDGAAIAHLARAARFDADAARDDAARFARVYDPIGILPPDHYLSTVLQATSGCSFGTCTFCDLYHGAYRVRTPEEFDRHVAAVRDYLGDSMRLRGRAVFLGAANALAVPMPALSRAFEIVSARFDGAPPPVHTFADGFTGARKSPADFARLRELGLRRVYVGLESGHDPLLAFVRKPATSRETVEAVRSMKAGGLSVGVIVMVGLGGRRFGAGHVTDTIAALDLMALGDGDLVYFSDLVEVPGTAYPRIAAEEDLEALTLVERLAQASRIRTGLTPAGPPPRFARYDVREFVY